MAGIVENGCRICPKCRTSRPVEKVRCAPCDLARKRRFAAANPDVLRERQARAFQRYYARHRDRAHGRVARWSRENPDQVAVANARKRARSYGVASDLTIDQWRAILASADGRCTNCREERKLEIDHIVAMRQGGPNTAANVQALCRPCNSKKSRAERGPIKGKAA